MNNIIRISALILFLTILIIQSCKDKPTPPVLTTVDVTAITYTTATSGGEITIEGAEEIASKGICWSTSANPTILNSKTIEGGGLPTFTSSMTQLTPNTIYYVRAYATNIAGTGYGNEIMFTTIGTVTDIESNVYNVVQIGAQIWMRENLKTTKYRNSDPILNVTDSTEWITLTTGAYCNYNNDANNAITYGRLYNWYSIADSRNIAPEGWHIPTDAEWITLTNFLGEEAVAGGKLKETGTIHWNSPNTGATNESGFTALPGGYRDYFGSFYNIGIAGYWLSSTEDQPTTDAWYRGIANIYTSIWRSSIYNHNGLSVRCVKD